MEMGTSKNAVMFLVSKARCSYSGGLQIREIRTFDFEQDAKNHILANTTKTAAGGYLTQQFRYWRLYRCSPVKSPKRIEVDAKYLGVEC